MLGWCECLDNANVDLMVLNKPCQLGLTDQTENGHWSDSITLCFGVNSIQWKSQSFANAAMYMKELK